MYYIYVEAPKRGVKTIYRIEFFFSFSSLFRRGRELTVGCSIETALSGVIFFLLARQPIVVEYGPKSR
jgi:hypothetical protein